MKDIKDLVEEVVEEFRGFSHNPFNVKKESREDVPSYLRTLQPSYVRSVSDIVEAFPPAHKGVRLLEIGAYFGVVSICLARLGYSVEATDIPEFISNPQLQEKLEKHGVSSSAVNLSGYSLPFEDGSFDIVVFCEVLEHLNFNPLPVLKEINRVMEEGGLLYLSLPNVASFRNRMSLLAGRSIHNPVKDFFSQLDESGGMIVGLHWREYTAEEVREMLGEMGFSIERQYYFSSLDGVPGTGQSPVQRLKGGILGALPSLKENHTTFARKTRRCDRRFFYTEATLPGRE